MKRNVKVFTALLLAVIMMFSFGGCGKLDKGEKVVREMLDAFAAADLDKAGKYINLEELTGSGSEVAIAGSAESYLKAALTGFGYEIFSVEEANDGSVNVGVRIFTVSMKSVVNEFLVKAMQYLMESASSEQRPSQQETEKKLDELIKESAELHKGTKVTNEVIMNVAKIDGKWSVDANERVFDAIFGGLVTAVDEVKNGVE